MTPAGSLAWKEIFKRVTRETDHENCVRDAEAAIVIRQVELGNSAADREERSTMSVAVAALRFIRTGLFGSANRAEVPHSRYGNQW
ncbi:MAG TPA: hypothetical protein VIH56_09485 [Candidatus Acidoferrales bacterium]|jgi:hypothetical protein